MSDNVNNPSHYNQGGVECIDCIKSAVVNKKGIEAVCVANVIKYLFRYETKNGIEDVKKAQWYLNRLIQELEGNHQDIDKFCYDCKYKDYDSDMEPCISCRNCYTEDSEEHKTYPLKFQSRH